MARTRRRGRAKTARVALPSNFTPRTCPQSACPCTRNGALLPQPPTARMHVPAHMTTPYSRIFSSQWLWNRAFSPLLSLSSRASSLPRNCGRTRTTIRLPKPLVEFRSVPRVCRLTRHGTRERNINFERRKRPHFTTNCNFVLHLQPMSFFLSWKKIEFFLIINTFKIEE